jgi:hypothetical protein
VHKDGSQVKGDATLGAGVLNPRKNNITHFEIKWQLERHSIHRAEIADITMALRHEYKDENLSILANNSF